MRVKRTNGEVIDVGSLVKLPDGNTGIVEDIANGMVHLVDQADSKKRHKYPPEKLGLKMAEATITKKEFDRAREKLRSFWKE